MYRLLYPYLEVAAAVRSIGRIESKHVSDTASHINSDPSVFMIHNGGIDELFGDGCHARGVHGSLFQVLKFRLKFLYMRNAQSRNKSHSR